VKRSSVVPVGLKTHNVRQLKLYNLKEIPAFVFECANLAHLDLDGTQVAPLDRDSEARDVAAQRQPPVRAVASLRGFLPCG
jgi:hypothetical protein